MSVQSAAFLAIALMLSLFAVAAYVESHLRMMRHHVRLRRYAYILALGVYCSSWTFYGAVGSAVASGWNYLPIYLGPVMLLLLAPRFLKLLAQAIAEEQATSISDFIASRFGHDIAVARLVTIIALLGIVPYIALQLRSIGAAVSFVSGEDAVLPVMIASAVLLGLFAMLFGTRRYEVAGRNEGLLFAISLESIIKFSALLIVALLALAVFFRAPQVDSAHAAARLADNFHPQFLSIETGVIFLISVMAIIVLPRQFYMGFVEVREPDSFVQARFGLAAYVGGMALLVLPIALGGMAILPDTTPPDVYVLGVPLNAGSQFIAALALLGGVAAAASMAIVDTTALATMVSNDLVLPSLLRGDFAMRAGAAGKRVLAIRRLLVISIMALALLWGSMLGENRSLASIGLIAFAAMAQFTPHFILGVFAPGR
ncbi:MAG: hybrid sensor histidine kinase/response regulator, partial [Sphingomonadaceae bacterium]